MLRAIRRLGIPLCIVLALGAFAWQYRSASAGSLPASSTYDDGNIVIRVHSNPEGARAMREQWFQIEVNDANGKPIEGARIETTLRMPKMYCGEFEASIVSDGSGLYEATAIPVMTGRWEAETVVKIDDERYVVKHPFLVKG